MNKTTNNIAAIIAEQRRRADKHGVIPHDETIADNLRRHRRTVASNEASQLEAHRYMARQSTPAINTPFATLEVSHG